MPNRTARQCREQYKTYPCPDVNVSPWTDSEDCLLAEKFRELGSKWREFRQSFLNRSVNNIKNRWHKLARKGRANKQIPVTSPTDPTSIIDISNLLNRPVIV
jgi:hypothetical protein